MTPNRAFPGHASLALALLLATAGASLLVPSAAGHCPDDAEQAIVAGISTCTANEHLEEAVEELNKASDNETVYVLVKDLGFHPSVVNVTTGGTIVFVWGDVDRSEQHDPKSSGVGTDPDCQDAWRDPVDCRPQNPGGCFSLSDASNFLSDPGDTYPVTLRVDDDGTVQVSEGYASGSPVVGEPPFAPRFTECPDGTAAEGPWEGSHVVPYHCGIHGGPHTTEQTMRGAVILRT